jgi:hypothetical protein
MGGNEEPIDLEAPAGSRQEVDEFARRQFPEDLANFGKLVIAEDDPREPEETPGEDWDW